jgi:hypothetical protein
MRLEPWVWIHIRRHLLPEVARVPHEARIVKHLVHSMCSLKHRGSWRCICRGGEVLLRLLVTHVVVCLPSLSRRSLLRSPLALKVESLAMGAPRPLLVTLDLSLPNTIVSLQAASALDLHALARQASLARAEMPPRPGRRRGIILRGHSAWNPGDQRP